MGSQSWLERVRPLLPHVRTQSLPGSSGCSGWNKPPMAAGLTPNLAVSQSFNLTCSASNALRLSSSVVPNARAWTYLKPSSALVGVHHMLPDTLLLPPSCSFLAFSRTTTVTPASCAATAAAKPANPVPSTTTSTSLSHLSGAPAAMAGVVATEPRTPVVATAAPAIAASFKNCRRLTLTFF